MKPAEFERWQELEDLKYRASLVQCRLAAGLTVHDIAVAMGVSDVFVARIEDFEEDAHLSTLRRYAVAVGAAVHHNVYQMPTESTDELAVTEELEPEQ